MGALTYSGNIITGMPTNASQVNYDNSSSGMAATQVQDAVDELKSGLTDVNSKITSLLKYKVFTDTASDTTYHLYSTGVSISQYVCIGGYVPYYPNLCIQLSNIEETTTGFIRYRLYDVVTNQIVSDNAAYTVYLVFVDKSMISEL